MNTDLQGKIRNTKLPKSKPLCPLFEAISNSIDAIRDAKRGDGRIEITLERDELALALEGKRDDYPIKSIKIKDNGIGFDEGNYNSFLTAESTYKRGAKGIGRFIWLKAFDTVSIQSTFKENGNLTNRTFDFLPEGDGIHGHMKDVTADKDFSTIVHLKDIKEEHQKLCPSNLREIAYSIVEHFIVHFLLGTCPNISLSDEANSIDLDDVYREQIISAAESVPFEVNGKGFTLFLTKLYNTHLKKHQIHLCAHNREVKNSDLNGHIRELRGKINDEKGDYLYQAYVIGNILDENVNAERADFTISLEESLFDDINEREILEAAVHEVKQILEDYIHEVRMAKDDRIKEHVNNNEPQYKPLVNHRPDLVADISPGLSDEDLSIELFKKQKEFDIDLKKQHSEFLADDLDKIEDLDQYKREYEEFIEKSNDVGKSRLVKYVIHRKSVLDLLDRRLSIKSDDTNWKEESVHELIFPLKKTSDDIPVDQQNLWIIDERLSYHEYLASDMPLSKAEPIETKSKLRPDLVIFNRPFAFVNDEFRYESMVIIEFKKPGRENYTNNNPIDQILKYIDEIKDGKVKDRKGRYIQVNDNIPFYVYIICELTPRITTLFRYGGFTKTPDGNGYFNFRSEFSAYIEVISYQKLLKNSKERNRVLFDKLGIPKLINV